MLAVASGMLLKAGADDPAYEMRTFEPLCTYIRGHVQPSDVLIVQPYPGPAWQYLMNAECGQGVWYSLPYHEPTAELETPQLAEEQIAPEDPRRLTLLVAPAILV